MESYAENPASLESAKFPYGLRMRTLEDLSGFPHKINRELTLRQFTLPEEVIEQVR